MTDRMEYDYVMSRKWFWWFSKCLAVIKDYKVVVIEKEMVQTEDSQDQLEF
jgi:hypothetical protein